MFEKIIIAKQNLSKITYLQFDRSFRSIFWIRQNPKIKADVVDISNTDKPANTWFEKKLFDVMEENNMHFIFF